MNREVEINGFKTTMLCATGSSSNCIPENQLRYIYPNYLANLRPSRGELYWNILGKNIGEVDLDLKVGQERLTVTFCVVRNASVKMSIANPSGECIVAGFPLMKQLNMVPGLCRLLDEVEEDSEEPNVLLPETDWLLSEADVMVAATARGWDKIAERSQHGLMRFQKDAERINIFCPAGAVQTILDHPIKESNVIARFVKNIEDLAKLMDSGAATSNGYRHPKTKRNKRKKYGYKH